MSVIKKNWFRACLMWGALVLFVTLTNPASVPVLVLVVPYILLFLALLFSLNAFFDVYHPDKKIFGRSWLPGVAAACLVVMLALRSIGQLGFRDIIAVVLIVGLGYFYIKRNRPAEKK